MAVRLTAHTPRGGAFDLLYRCMDNAALVRVHRLERGFPAGTRSLIADFACQPGQRLLALLAVVADIQRHTVIAVLHPIRHQASQILQRVKRVAAMADDKTEILAFERQHTAVFFLLNFNGRTFRAHSFEQLGQVFLCGGSRRDFHEYPHPRGASAKQAECLFLRRLQDLHLYFVRREAEFRGSSLPGFLYCGGFLDRFLEHDSTSLSLLVVSLWPAPCYAGRTAAFPLLLLIPPLFRPLPQPARTLLPSPAAPVPNPLSQQPPPPHLPHGV